MHSALLRWRLALPRLAGFRGAPQSFASSGLDMPVSVAREAEKGPTTSKDILFPWLLEPNPVEKSFPSLKPPVRKEARMTTQRYRGECSERVCFIALHGSIVGLVLKNTEEPKHANYSLFWVFLPKVHLVLYICTKRSIHVKEKGQIVQGSIEGGGSLFETLE